MLADSQVRDYLDILGVAAPPQPGKEALDELILRHQCTIPFQTVTLHRTGDVPSLAVQDVYDKVVARRLGGYCFELNKAFGELLSALGFSARPCLCRSVRGRDALMPINHRGILVSLDGALYSADVGFGGPMPAGALLLEDGAEQEVCGDTYLVQRVDGAWWNIDRLTRSKLDLYDDDRPARRQTELVLCTAAVEEVDFDALNAFNARPGTLFSEHEIANLRTDGGYVGLRDGVLTVRRGGEKAVTELADRAAVDGVLAEVFGIVRPEG